jgi:predicted nucleic acid-binding Zn ribbon protein
VAPGYIISLPPCENTCSDLYTKCNDILTAAAAAQASGFTIVPVPILGDTGKCDQDFFGGDTPFVQAAAEDNWVTKYPYEPGYEGERVFPEESVTYTLDGEEHEVKCFDFSNFKVSCEDSRGETTCGSYQKKNPYTADMHECIGEQCEDSAHIDSCNVKVCPSHMVSHSGLSSCSRDCWEICPSNRKYEESEYSTMFLVYVIPGLLAIPMNMYISVGFAVGRKTVHKKARPYLTVAGYLMLLWGIFHIVPSAVMSTEMVCNDGTSESRGAKGICTFHRGTIHLLQSAYYWMTAAIIDLYMSIVLEYADRKRKQRAKGVMIFATVVPFAMMCWTYGMQVNDSESLLAVFDGVGGVD